jgi:hypothetical protein
VADLQQIFIPVIIIIIIVAIIIIIIIIIITTTITTCSFASLQLQLKPLPQQAAVLP